MDNVREHRGSVAVAVPPDGHFRVAGAPSIVSDTKSFHMHMDDLRYGLDDDRAKFISKDWDGDVRLMSQVARDMQEDGIDVVESARWRSAEIDEWIRVLLSALLLLRQIISRNDGLAARAVEMSGARMFDFLQCLLGDGSPIRPSRLRDAEPSFAAPYPSRESIAESLRTSATGALVGFMFRESEVAGGDSPAISRQAKDLVDACLALETSPVPLFMLGQGFSEMHRLDPEWALGLPDRLFPKGPDRRLMHIGAWTGFLSNVVTSDQFFSPEFQELFRRGLDLRTKPEERIRAGYYFEPERGIANHFAIAFVEFDGFGFDHHLFRRFRESASQEQMSRFVEVVGRQIRGDDAKVGDLAKKRVLEFWGWLLEEWDGLPPFLGLGWWMNTRSGVFPPGVLAELAGQSLRKTAGALGSYHQLTRSMPDLASASPEHAAGITRLFLHGESVMERDREFALSRSSEWLEAARRFCEREDAVPDARSLLREIECHGGES